MSILMQVSKADTGELKRENFPSKQELTLFEVEAAIQSERAQKQTGKSRVVCSTHVC